MITMLNEMVSQKQLVSVMKKVYIIQSNNNEIHKNLPVNFGWPQEWNETNLEYLLIEWQMNWEKNVFPFCSISDLE